MVGETKEEAEMTMMPRAEVHAIREVRRSGVEWIRRMGKSANKRTGKGFVEWGEMREVQVVRGKDGIFHFNDVVSNKDDYLLASPPPLFMTSNWQKFNK